METQDFNTTNPFVIRCPKANETLEDSNDSTNEAQTTSTHQATDKSAHETNDTNDTNDTNLQVPTTSTHQASDHSTLKVRCPCTNLYNIPILNMNWNQEIPQEVFDAFQYSFEGCDYIWAIRDVFLDVFETVKSDRYYINKTSIEDSRLCYRESSMHLDLFL